MSFWSRAQETTYRCFCPLETQLSWLGLLSCNKDSGVHRNFRRERRADALASKESVLHLLVIYFKKSDKNAHKLWHLDIKGIFKLLTFFYITVCYSIVLGFFSDFWETTRVFLPIGPHLTTNPANSHK